MASPPRISSRRIGLRDIALASDVTIPTVSRVLNQQTKGFSVKPEVRQRVLEAAARLNYKPNVLAQSLRKKKMGLIGLLNYETSLQYLPQVIEGLLSVTSQHDMELCSSYAASPGPIQRMPVWRIDGAAVVSALSAEKLAPLRNARVPFVSINGYADADTLAVSFNDLDGAQRAMSYLLRLGHTRIAYIPAKGPWNTHVSVSARHQAYVSAMASAGLAPLPHHDQPWDSSFDDMVRVLVSQHQATAIVTYHNYGAVSVLQSLHRLGFRVPHDVSLLSLHDGYPLDFLYPAVTGVELPFREAGQIAGQMLMDMLHPRGEFASHRVLTETLRIRESTAPPPRG